MNKLIKELTTLAEEHNLSIAYFQTEEQGSDTRTIIEFVKDNRVSKSNCIGPANE